MKGLLLAILMMTTPLSAASSDVFLLTDSAYIYAEADYSSEQLVEVSYGEKMTLESDQITSGFYYVTFVQNEESFTGYINADVVGQKADSQDVVLSYNASMSADAEVFNISDGSKICDIKKGEKVLLFEGYSNKKDELAIKFVRDGKVIIGKVRTECVKPYGVNSALIISLTAITALVSVTLILLGITKKKRH